MLPVSEILAHTTPAAWATRRDTRSARTDGRPPARRPGRSARFIDKRTAPCMPGAVLREASGPPASVAEGQCIETDLDRRRSPPVWVAIDALPSRSRRRPGYGTVGGMMMGMPEKDRQHVTMQDVARH